MDDWIDTVGLTLVGLALIIGLYMSMVLIANNAKRNAEKTKVLRIEKLQACRTIQDEGMRTLCIVLGGKKTDG